MKITSVLCTLVGPHLIEADNPETNVWHERGWATKNEVKSCPNPFFTTPSLLGRVLRYDLTGNIAFVQTRRGPQLIMGRYLITYKNRPKWVWQIYLS